MTRVAQPQRIGIVLMGAIGDVCRALPLATRIKRFGPECEIIWAVEPKSQGLVEFHASVDRVVVFDRPRGLRAFWKFTRELADLKCDVILDLQRHLKSGVTSFRSQAPRRIGFSRRNAKELNWLFNSEYIAQADDTLPKIEHYQYFGDVLDIPPAGEYDFGLEISNAAHMRAEALINQCSREQNVQSEGLRGRAMLVIGASWPSKVWFPELYVELIRKLREDLKLLPVIVGGKLERGLGSAILKQCSHGEVLNLIEKTPLHDLIAVLASARVAIGSDSGPMHIAGAVGVGLVVLMGPTSSDRTAPYARQRIILQSQVGCAPCYRRRCPGLGQLCMRSIEPLAVATAVAQIVDLPSDGHCSERSNFVEG